MIYLTVIIGIALVALLLLPFFIGPGGLLAAGSSVSSKDSLVSLKDVIIQRYLEDEKAHATGDLGNLAWERRRSFLINRYIDASRRLDFLVHNENAAHASANGKGGEHAH